MNEKDIIDKLKVRIAEKTDNTNAIRSEDNKDAMLLKDAVTLLNSQNVMLNNLRAQLTQQQINDTLSTTQFFDPSLAKDFYNMNGNALATNSYMAIRQMIGIVNNNTPNVKQQIQGVNLNNNDGSGGTLNGSAVGLTQSRQTQGWWLWELTLERINYFTNLFIIECSDKKLLKAIHEYIQCTVLSGYGAIVKTENGYQSWAITNIVYNEDGTVKSGDKYNPGFVINAIHLKDKEGLSEFNITNDTVIGRWRTDGYNIWFFVMSYLFNAVDLIYIYWNRARLNKTIIEQRKGNNSTASQEAMNYISAYQNVVTINTVSMLDNNNQAIERENRYEIKDLGNGQETQFSYTAFTNWIWNWDNTIGIRSTPGSGGDGTRSITDEVQPLKLRINKIQRDMLFQLQCLCDDIKDKWGIEVKVSIEDLEQVKQNPETKDEGGNESEQDLENVG